MEVGQACSDIDSGDNLMIEHDINDFNYDYDLYKPDLVFSPNDPSNYLGRGVRLCKQNLVEAGSSDYCMSPNFVTGYFSPSDYSDSYDSGNERLSVKSLVNSFNKQIASYKSSLDKSSDRSSDKSILDYGNSPYLTYTSSLEEFQLQAFTGRTIHPGRNNYYQNYVNNNGINIQNENDNQFSMGYNHLLHRDMFDMSFMAERGMVQSFNHYNGPYIKHEETAMIKSARRQSIGLKNSFSNTDRIFVIKRGLARICFEPDFEWETMGVAIFESDQTRTDFYNDQLPHSNISTLPTFNLSNSLLFNFSNPDHYDRDEYNFGASESEKYLITYSDPTVWDVSKTIVTGAYIRAFRIEQYQNKDSSLLNFIKSGMEKLFQPFLLDETWSSFKAYPLDLNAVDQNIETEKSKPLKLFVEFLEEFKGAPQPSPVRQSKPTSIKDLTLAVNVFSLVKKRH